MSNKLIIAVAGSGKTTFLVKKALAIKTGRILITTYTTANEHEIKIKFLKLNGVIPSNVTIKTWFSFLLEHGVKPYQSYILNEKIKGVHFSTTPSGVKYSGSSGPVYYSEEREPSAHYSSANGDIYSDKISKFVFNCNKKSINLVVNRISQIFTHIFIDEVQDLAGYDLEVIKLFLLSNTNVVLVGDPRQVTYITHHPIKNKKYLNGAIKNFIQDNLSKKLTCDIDETSLCYSHRNNKDICKFSSLLYPSLPPSHSCQCPECISKRNVDHKGLFLVKQQDVDLYIRAVEPVQLRWSKDTKVSPNCQVYNFGESKGLGFPHVLIYLTSKMKNWLEDNSVQLSIAAKAKLYVAITRAQHSVAFVYNYDTEKDFAELNKFHP